MNIYIYGTGSSCERLLKGLKKDINVLAFIDSNPDKQGKFFYGKSVIGFNKIDRNFDYIVVASQYVEIYNNLINAGISNEKIILFEQKNFEEVTINRRHELLEKIYESDNFAFNLHEPGHYYSPIANLKDIKKENKKYLKEILIKIQV